MTTKKKMPAVEKLLEQIPNDFKPVGKIPRMKLVYDIASIPKGLSFDVFAKIYDQHHMVLWDSKGEGTKPKLYGSNDDEAPLMLMDTEGREIDIEFWTREFKDKEYWDKELHNCKMSPIYFYSNYGTPVWPHTNEGLKEYLAEVGLEEVTAKDSEDAKVQWEKQKAKLKVVAENYTLELLKERKGALEVERSKYNSKVLALEKLLAHKVRLVDSNNVPLEKRKAMGNIIEKLRKFLPVDKRYSEKYRTPKGKWDNAMLFMTNYDVLLEMFYEVLQVNGKLDLPEVDSPTGVAGGANLHVT
jgi:hypothetical protein